METPPGTPLPRRGRCITGLTYTTMPLRIGRRLRGILVLGPYLDRPRTEAGFRALCRRLGISEWEHMRWAWGETPVLTSTRERALHAFCRDVFGRIHRRFAALDEGRTWDEVMDTAFDHVYAPARLADDFPLRVFGVFVTYGEIRSPGKPSAPLDSCDLEYVDRGRMRVDVDGRTLDVPEGSMVLLLPGSRPRLSPAPDPGECDTISVAFVANASLLAPFANRTLRLDPLQSALLARLSRLAAAQNEAAHRDSQVKLLLMQLLLSARDAVAGPGPDANRPASTDPGPGHRQARLSAAIQEARRIIELSVERRIRVPELARLFHMGVPTFRRRFKAEVGLSPKRRHPRQRVLREGQTATRIAERLGFHSVHHFSRVFRQLTSVSPSAYARSHRASLRQIEEARILLGQGMPPAQVARALGFPSVAVFSYRFRNATGSSPEQFAQALNRTHPARPAAAPRAAHARMPRS
jgi:AraC-like DNA-binding protein